jgi:hypothetical protein
MVWYADSFVKRTAEGKGIKSDFVPTKHIQKPLNEVPRFLNIPAFTAQ